MSETRGAKIERTIGLFGATGVGVGAIVGGGILALAGVAFSSTGPSALVAFALNGVIALLTALSFAEMSAVFPESGGTYTFARKFLDVRVAFGVGWIVWFASLVAAVLYALGFGAFALLAIRTAMEARGSEVPAWLASRWSASALAVLATLWFAQGLLRKGGGGGPWINVAKTAVFALVIAGGLWLFARTPGKESFASLKPFFAGGAGGLFQAMGFTFIALQGFDLIAAVGGEIKDPARNIPRAMILSLGIALGIYLPLLFVVASVGVSPGESIVALGREQPEGVIAVAARRFLGSFGYWLVIGAGVLSMLSALQANLFAASRVAFAMARDRTLSPVLGNLDPKRGIPRLAVGTVTGLVVLVLVVVPDVATAGAASSLIFLITFFVAHGVNLLLHRRMDAARMPFRAPWFPAVPLVGGGCCLALGIYQGVAVPVAGAIAAGWLAVGGWLYAVRFAPRAKAFDASTEGSDPELMRFRGRNPLVVVPVSNAANAASLVTLAHAVSPPGFSRVMLLTVVRPPAEWKPGEPPPSLLNMEAVVREALTASFAAGLAPEALLTVSGDHWGEMARVARIHRCEVLVLGLRSVTEQTADPQFDRLLARVPCDVVILRAPRGWNLAKTKRVLVAIGGRGRHSPLRARLLGNLRRLAPLETTYLCVLPAGAAAEEERRVGRVLRARVEDEMGGEAETVVVRGGDPGAEIARRASECDLLVLGLHDLGRKRRALGDFAARLARETTCPLVILGHRF